ncbi:MAG: zinc-dependent alcohol dehydrogenase family protein [Thermoguttaceae bacterium]|nr:zinc-dependent alcohol dehydrogenase family protein [Thermoguttaceae bacterium]MDW8037030.1 zinc-dependent alcohol dehydrogenase family protein [Thermoguttaceae bacterium]
MKAMVLERVDRIENNPLRLMELPIPELQAGYVRVRVRACAICRTDLHVIEGELPGAKLPVVPGHQVVGQVEALGPNCRRFQLGERVGIAWLRQTCGQCEFCRTGKENLCEAARFTGYHADGGYAEYALVREDFAYRIPELFTDQEAAPLLCAGIIGYRAFRRAQVPPAGRLALYGFGSSAHVVLQLAQARGCEVFVVSRAEKHRQLARQMGADWVGQSAEQLPCKVHSAIIFAPAGQLVPPALEKLQKGGTLALAGIYMTPIPQMDYQRYVFYERDIRSVTSNTRQDGEELLAEAARIPIRPHTTVYPLTEANRALQDLKADQIAGTGVLQVD